MIRIAFICTGNSCRSQMAEGLARKFSKQGIEIYSAGITPVGVNPKTATVMREAGIDISKQYSKDIEALPKELDFVITVCGNAAKYCPELAARIEKLHWDIDDPIVRGKEEEILEDFRRIRDEIRKRVANFLKERNFSQI